MKLQHIFYILFLILGSSSCNQDDLANSNQGDLELTDQFSASLYESFDVSGKRSITLVLETLEEFSCNNYELEVDFRKESRDIYLDIKGIYRPENVPCEEGINIATASIELGQLDITEYTIHLKLLDQLEEEGKLDNTISHIDMDFPKDGWMQVNHERMIKVPGNTIWGYFLSENGHFDQLAADYIDGLESFGAPLENDGYFGVFTVQQGQVKIIVKEPNNTTTVYNGFGMKYSGDHEVLKQWIVDNYCDESGNIGLLSTNGDLTPCD